MIHQLLNTLYVQTQGAYLHLDHDTLVVESQGQTLLQVPLHHLGSVALFGNVLVSPFLLERCATDGRSVVWFTPSGEFVGRLMGPVSGNVLLRLAQYKAAEDPERTLLLARRFVMGKVRNARTILQRAARDQPEKRGELEPAVAELGRYLERIDRAETLDELRGLEGQAAAVYLARLSSLITVDDLHFERRSRRPPRDPVNALLSFAYSLLSNDCQSALEGAGLDPQVGFLHTVRPGRPALALDLMEEFRAILADRLVLTLLNRKQLTPADFVIRPGGAVYLTDEGRRTFLAAYQKRKQEEVTHPLLRERVPFGLLPHVQARLLARFLRGDAEQYVPFLYR